MLARKVLVGSIHIVGGHGTNQLLSFARNLLIARLVGPHEFGLGLTFLLVVSFLDMAADLSWNKFIVQDRDGERPEVQATLHTILLIRGLLCAAGLFLTAELVVDILGVPAETAWAYRALALVPLFGAFVHLDTKRYQRDLRYFPDVASNAIGNAASLAVGVGAAMLLHDYRAILAAVLARYLAAAIATHLFAQQAYRLGLDREVAKRAWGFGWPLLINGGVLFVAGQGDRAVIVRAFGPEVFGTYGAAALLVQAMATLLTNIINSIGLPILAQRQGSLAHYERGYVRIGGVVAVVIVCMVAGAFLVLPSAVPILYGAGFEVPSVLIALLILVAAVHLFRAWGVMACLALGASRFVMWANVLRGAAVALALLAVLAGGDILTVTAAQLAGEMLAAGLVFWLLSHRYGFGIERPLILFSIIAAVSAACLAAEMLWGASGAGAWMLVFPAILAAGLGALFFTSAEVRMLARDLRAVVAG